MIIKAKVKLRAKEEKIEKDENGDFIVRVKELPVEGRANKAVMRILAGYFNVPVSSIRIVSGFKSRQKTIEIV